jgi:uncharacterized membrane protein (UPF0127 family)
MAMGSKRLERLDWIELDGCPRVYVADDAAARLIGLAWLDDLPDGCGLLIPNCHSIHTFGMRFALDVDFLDGRRRPVRRVEAVPPRRVLWCRGATAVLERKAR